MAGVTEIEIPSEVQSKVITDAIDASGLESITNVVRVPNGKSSTFFTLGSQDARFHNPVSADKTVDTGSVGTLKVDLYDLYIIQRYQDFVPEYSPILIDSIKNEMGSRLGETLQKSIFGTAVVPTSPWGSLGTADAIDTTDPKALVGEADKVRRANGWIFNADARADLRTALTAGTTQNALTYPVSDGMEVAGIPAYFSTLGVPSTTVAGIVGDFSQAVLAVATDLQISVVDGSTDSRMQEMDAVQLKVKMRVGFAAADPAKNFRVFKTASSK